MNYSLFQEHTTKIYDLRNHEPTISKIKARDLLTPRRFDLFAKLYYIKHFNANKQLAVNVYTEHIKAFNPDEREPGRDDKNTIEDFITAFNQLIDHFGSNDFDDSISLIPTDCNGTILDGAHRVAALAFFDKEVTIAQFNDVKAKNDFDYLYFKKRGLAWSVCDTIALEMTYWCKQLFVACIWPNIGDKITKNEAASAIAQSHYVCYMKSIATNLSSLKRFVKAVYSAQSWTQSDTAVQDKALRCYGGDKSIWFVFFKADTDLETLIAEKEILRKRYGKGKDSLHITDNIEETQQIAVLVLEPSRLHSWLNISPKSRFIEHISEKWYYFKKVTWINFKVQIARYLKN